MSPPPALKEPFHDVFPEGFLKDVSVYEDLGVYMAIGLVESEVVPTLDYSEFYRLSNCGQPVSWKGVENSVVPKYTNLARNLDDSWLSEKTFTEPKQLQKYPPTLSR